MCLLETHFVDPGYIYQRLNRHVVLCLRGLTSRAVCVSWGLFNAIECPPWNIRCLGPQTRQDKTTVTPFTNEPQL